MNRRLILVVIIIGSILSLGVFSWVYFRSTKQLTNQKAQTGTQASTTSEISPSTKNVDAVDLAKATIQSVIDNESRQRDSNKELTENQQMAVMTLYRADELGVKEQASSTKLGMTILQVSYPPNDNGCNRLYAAPFCAFLVKKTDGSVSYFKLLSDAGEDVQAFLPEGLLLHSSGGDGGGGGEEYALLDLATKQVQSIMQMTFEAGCAAEKDDIAGNGLNIQILTKEDDSCHRLPDLTIQDGKRVFKIINIADQGYQIEIDPLQTLRNSHRIYFSVVTNIWTRTFVYDGTSLPARLIEVNK